MVVIALAAGCFTLTTRGQETTKSIRSANRVSTIQPGSQQQTSAEVTTLRAFSNLVVIDVVVADAQGNPVHGLKASDFTLLENNQLQTMRNFEEHTASLASDASTNVPVEKLPPGTFTNKLAAPANGPVNVLLLDYLNTPIESQPFARQQLQEFLDKAPAGTRIAIFGLTERLSMLQGFTSDMSVLKAALKSKKGTPQVSDILENPLGGMDPQGAPLEVDALAKAIADNLGRFKAMQASFAQEMRAKYTLHAFDTLARYLVGIPGRKNVIWFSGGFPLDVEPSLAEADPNDSVVRNDEEVRKTDNLLARAQVAMYPVDARGVMTPKEDQPLPDYDKSQQASAMDSGSAKYGGPNGAKEASKAFSAMEGSVQTAREHGSMFAMAEDTGGEAFVNTNGLAQAVASAVEHGSNYYTLTYSPSNTKWDERFRSVKVKVNLSGVDLTYRNGYYAVDPSDRNKRNAQGAATALAETNTMSTAMMRGGPDATQILFRVKVDKSPTTTTLAADNHADPKQMKPPYRRYSISFLIDVHGIDFAPASDGNYRGAFEYGVRVYNADGDEIVNSTVKTVSPILLPAIYQSMLDTGAKAHRDIDVPATGNYFLRIAVHDLTTNRVGSIEIPTSAIDSAQQEPRKD